MKKRVISLMLVLSIISALCCTVWGVEIPVTSKGVSADNAVQGQIVVDPGMNLKGEIEKLMNDDAKKPSATENTATDATADKTEAAESTVAQSGEKLTADKLTVYATVIQPEGEIISGNMTINVFSENDVWLHNSVQYIASAGEYVFEFNVPEFEAGTKFKVYMSEGAEYMQYGTTKCYQHQYFVLNTPAVPDTNGNLYIANMAGITVAPLHNKMWEFKAEEFVNSKEIKSSTPYMIWVSKANYTVSVFAAVDGKWKCIRYFPCSIGAPNTATVVGEFEYIEHIKKWYYPKYYVGPVMRFYRGYAIHSTLISNDGTDYDARTGKMISLGCVRVVPENMNWLAGFIPMNTKIYITNE